MKPLCDQCKTRHESYQGHIWPRAVANVVVNVANTVANKKKKPSRYRDAEKRRVYMRELMRKIRSKA